MANLSSVSGSPITFVGSGGAQFSIPLTFVSFPTATGAPTVATWPLWSGEAGPEQSNVTNWLAYLALQGLLLPNIALPPATAFTITARDAGAAGNDITVRFGNVVPNSTTPSATTVDVTVSTSQVYKSLTTASIATVLGTAPLGGTQPGLAYVATPLTSLPSDMAATGFSGTPLQFAAPGSGGALELAHAAAGEAADAGLVQAAISDVNATAGTFTLTLSWTKKQTAVKLSDLPATFAYLITITPSAGGFAYAPAANSSVTLVGGTDPTTILPSPAEAAVVPG
jgi:hypothetical protein